MTTFVAIRCWRCDVVYGMSDTLHASRTKDGETFFCPNGHQASYHETEAMKLRRERDRLTQRLAEKDDEIKRQREMREGTERRLSAAKGQVTKIKNRVGNGVCPCCNRTFENLQRHMSSKHPTFTAEAAE